MTHTPADQHTPPTPAELREQIEQTRHDLGVQDLADRTDARARAQQRAGQLKEQAVVKAAELKIQAAKSASQVQDKLPAPVKEKAAQAAAQARTAAAKAGQVWGGEGTRVRAGQDGSVRAAGARQPLRSARGWRGRRRAVADSPPPEELTVAMKRPRARIR
ncbi:DUF3618 domain-containing protein [Streptomyces sp. NPDC048512]|uniref:DUF3618 domain-containing protein n=1 Tax=Streptomyces sp. NPDC048512 TaxID=3365563 RepID=UPI003721E3E9